MAAPDDWPDLYRELLEDAWVVKGSYPERVTILVQLAAEIRAGLDANLLGLGQELRRDPPDVRRVPLVAVPMRREEPGPAPDPCRRCGSRDHHVDNHDEAVPLLAFPTRRGCIHDGPSCERCDREHAGGGLPCHLCEGPCPL